LVTPSHLVKFNSTFILYVTPLRIGLNKIRPAMILGIKNAVLYQYLISHTFAEPPIQLVLGTVSLGIKRPGREVPRLKNAWSYTSPSPIRLDGVVLS